ncbi:hypothetical protein BDZ88DRAFT_402815 [Geranomyces variabilis]|nr:hypothetical protein BDZ88DRAFT_402815 [Geranomyces variabilis]
MTAATAANVGSYGSTQRSSALPPSCSSSSSCRSLTRPVFLLSPPNSAPRARQQLLCAHKRFLHALAGAIARTQYQHSSSPSGASAGGSLSASPTIALAVSHRAFIRTIATGTAATREYCAPASQSSAAAAAAGSTSSTASTSAAKGAPSQFGAFTAQDLARLLRAGNTSGNSSTAAATTHLMMQRASAVSAEATGRRHTGRRRGVIDFDRVLAAIDRAVRSIIAVAKDVLGNPWVDLSLLAAALTAMSWYYIRRLGTSAAGVSAAAAAETVPTTLPSAATATEGVAASVTSVDDSSSVNLAEIEDIDEDYETSFSLAARSSDSCGDISDGDNDKAMFEELTARAERLAGALERAIAQAAQLDGTVAVQRTLICRLEEENRVLLQVRSLSVWWAPATRFANKLIPAIPFSFLLQKLAAALEGKDPAAAGMNDTPAQRTLVAESTPATTNASSPAAPASPLASAASASLSSTKAPVTGPLPGFLAAAHHLTPELRPRSPGLLSDSGWDDLTDVLLSAAMPAQ